MTSCASVGKTARVPGATDRLPRFDYFTANVYMMPTSNELCDVTGPVGFVKLATLDMSRRYSTRVNRPPFALNSAVRVASFNLWLAPVVNPSGSSSTSTRGTTANHGVACTFAYAATPCHATGRPPTESLP